MLELVKFMVEELVDDKAGVVVTLDEDNTVNVKVSKADMGKVIGKDGRIAKAIRTIVKAAGNKTGVKYSVVILETE
ncbi:MAG: KH domain-containing protein [Clostridia bacterium]|nr:KH domain-containing protein [Clostridia bacterium]MBQ7224443.1 KH domain-containing protein [Clostridia bacterium]MBR7141172.1 KH domain-containing protein [Clostridia bacterium]